MAGHQFHRFRMSRPAPTLGLVEPIRRRALINNLKDIMSTDDKNAKSAEEAYGWTHENSLKHWRSWGSWFSWGSPVGLGLFFISIAVSLWILSQAFGWK
jgi:hypothetical protein